LNSARPPNAATGTPDAPSGTALYQADFFGDARWTEAVRDEVRNEERPPAQRPPSLETRNDPAAGGLQPLQRGSIDQAVLTQIITDRARRVAMNAVADAISEIAGPVGDRQYLRQLLNDVAALLTDRTGMQNSLVEQLVATLARAVIADAVVRLRLPGNAVLDACSWRRAIFGEDAGLDPEACATFPIKVIDGKPVTEACAPAAEGETRPVACSFLTHDDPPRPWLPGRGASGDATRMRAYLVDLAFWSLGRTEIFSRQAPLPSCGFADGSQFRELCRLVQGDAPPAPVPGSPPPAETPTEEQVAARQRATDALAARAAWISGTADLVGAIHVAHDIMGLLRPPLNSRLRTLINTVLANPDLGALGQGLLNPARWSELADLSEWVDTYRDLVAARAAMQTFVSEHPARPPRRGRHAEEEVASAARSPALEEFRQRLTAIDRRLRRFVWPPTAGPRPTPGASAAMAGFVNDPRASETAAPPAATRPTAPPAPAPPNRLHTPPPPRPPTPAPRPANGNRPPTPPAPPTPGSTDPDDELNFQCANVPTNIKGWSHHLLTTGWLDHVAALDPSERLRALCVPDALTGLLDGTTPATLEESLNRMREAALEVRAATDTLRRVIPGLDRASSFGNAGLSLATLDLDRILEIVRAMQDLGRAIDKLQQEASRDPVAPLLRRLPGSPDLGARFQPVRRAVVGVSRMLRIASALDIEALRDRGVGTVGDAFGSMRSLGGPVLARLGPVLTIIPLDRQITVETMLVMLEHISPEDIVVSLGVAPARARWCDEDERGLACWLQRIIAVLREVTDVQDSRVAIDSNRLVRTLGALGDDFRRRREWRPYFHLTIGLGEMLSLTPRTGGGIDAAFVPVMSEQIGIGVASPSFARDRLGFRAGLFASGVLYRLVLDSQESNAFFFGGFAALDLYELLEVFIAPTALVYPPGEPNAPPVSFGIIAGAQVPLSDYLSRL
jgi:hypothetical protein